MGKPYTNDEDKIIRKHFGIILGPELARLLPGRTVDSIRKRAKLLNIPGGGRKKMCAIAATRYSFAQGFFDCPNIECSYWAGFIAADGCICQNGISIGLAIKDKERLEKFVHAIAFNGPITKKITAYGPQSVLRIYGAHHPISALNKNYNITPRKSLTLKPPLNLSHNNTCAFIMGYIDGDGCINVTQQGYPRVFIRGTQSMLVWIKRTFDDIIKDVGNYPMASVRKFPSENTYTYALTGRRFVTVARELLALPLPFMERKWNKLQPFLS